MLKDLSEYFARIDQLGSDPAGWVELDDGRRIRSVHLREHELVRRSSEKRKRAAKWKADNPDKVAEEKKRWKANNPDKVAEQKNRARDRNYHRPFIAVDAEGQDFGGEPVMNAEYFILEDDEVDNQGNIYPKHRTILWAMGGWQRLHTSTELAAGIGLPTLGKECPSFFLGDEDKHMLHAVDIIEWLFESSAKYNKENGFPDGVNFIAFAFNYDVTQILVDFPRSKVWEITRKRSWKSKKRIKTPTLVDEYAIDYLKSKWLKIWKLRDPNHPYKDKLDKNGNVIITNGKPVREIDAIAYVCIEDAFGFYQSKFTKAIKPLTSQGYITKQDYDEIEYMKDHREEFDQLSFEEIKHYCNRELVCLSKALTVLRDGFDKMGKPDKPLRLRYWTGAGSPAGSLIRTKELKEKHYSPDIVVTKETMTAQQSQAHHAMIGGRIEPIQ